MVEAYKRQAEQMKKHEWREASMLQAPSGRQALREAGSVINCVSTFWLSAPPNQSLAAMTR